MRIVQRNFISRAPLDVDENDGDGCPLYSFHETRGRTQVYRIIFPHNVEES